MNLQALPEDALKEILALTEAKKLLDIRDEAQNKFMPFAHHVYENFIEGQHHRIIAEKLEEIAKKFTTTQKNPTPDVDVEEFAKGGRVGYKSGGGVETLFRRKAS